MRIYTERLLRALARSEESILSPCIAGAKTSDLGSCSPAIMNVARLGAFRTDQDYAGPDNSPEESSGCGCPQEFFPEHKRSRGVDPGGPDDDLPHAEAARTRSHRNDRRHTDALHRHQQIVRLSRQTARPASGKAARLIRLASSLHFSQQPSRPSPFRKAYGSVCSFLSLTDGLA